MDLGTNNCRLLIARPSRRGFNVVDAFSRIIRLGEGLTACGALSDDAMDRAVDALRVCASKVRRHGVKRGRFVATQACRIAANGEAFVARVRNEVGLDLEILTPEAEARLAVAGCASLIDPQAELAMVFDIGGGSSELIWLDTSQHRHKRPRRKRQGHGGKIIAWTSLPVGVVTLAERHNGRFVTPPVFEEMVADVLGMIDPFEREHRMRERFSDAHGHFLGTSGTVTTLAGIQMRLPKYDRRKVDGCWLGVDGVRSVTQDLLEKSYEERCAQPCIGKDRADLVLAGCAILEAFLRTWPAERLRVADRGLREGILWSLMSDDGLPQALRRNQIQAR
ncbi:MAG: Ppx/GppA phosphatase family protein [Pseudomonadota bacterium]